MKLPLPEDPRFENFPLPSLCLSMVLDCMQYLLKGLLQNLICCCDHFLHNNKILLLKLYFKLGSLLKQFSFSSFLYLLSLLSLFHKLVFTTQNLRMLGCHQGSNTEQQRNILLHVNYRNSMFTMLVQ